MKKVLSFIIFLSLLFGMFYSVPVSAAAPINEPVNYFSEGDFEVFSPGIHMAHSVVDGLWVRDGWHSGVGGEWTKGYISDEKAHSGSKSIKINGRNNYILRDLDVEANTDYVFYFYYNFEAYECTYEGASYQMAQRLYSVVAAEENAVYGSTGGGWSITPIKTQYYDGSKRSGAIATVNNKWTKVTFEFNSGNRTKIQLGMLYVDYCSNDDIPEASREHRKVYYDDFQLYKKADVTNGLTDGSAVPGIIYKGASLRVVGSPALRFKTAVNVDAIKEDYGSSYNVVELGASVIRTDYLSGKQLLPDTSYSYLGATKQPVTATLWTLNEGAFVSGKDYEAVLVNIASKNYGNYYSYRPYVKIYNGSNYITLYGTTEKASISDVAMLAVNSKNATTQEFSENVFTRELVNERYISKLTPNEMVVDNASEYYSTDAINMSWTVYHLTALMHNTTGRNYTRKQAYDEFDRLKDAGIKNVRTMFRSIWATGEDNATLRANYKMFENYNYEFSGWDFETDEMQAFLEAALAIQERGITAGLQCGWYLPWFYKEAPNEWYQECPYLHGNGDDYYGESEGYDFTGMTDEEIRLTKAGLRLGEFYSQALAYFRSRGCTNLKYMFVFTEPTNNTTLGFGGYWDAYIRIIEAMHDKMVEKGERSTVKFIGPNQACIYPTQEDLTMLKYVLVNIRDQSIIDIYSTHITPMGLIDNTGLHDSDFCWTYCDLWFESLQRIMSDYCYTGAPLISDEWGVSSRNYELEDQCWIATSSAVGLIASQKHKYKGISYWQIFDQLWWQSTSNSVEFTDGVHRTGTTNAIVESYSPYGSYYGISLMTKYLRGCTNVINSNFRYNDELYYTANESDDGIMTIVVTNTGKSSNYIKLSFTEDINKTLNRHLFDPASTHPTDDAQLALTDRSFNVTDELVDVIPSGGIAVYTTRID